MSAAASGACRRSEDWLRRDVEIADRIDELDAEAASIVDAMRELHVSAERVRQSKLAALGELARHRGAASVRVAPRGEQASALHVHVAHNNVDDVRAAHFEKRAIAAVLHREDHPCATKTITAELRKLCAETQRDCYQGRKTGAWLTELGVCVLLERWRAERPAAQRLLGLLRDAALLPRDDASRAHVRQQHRYLTELRDAVAERGYELRVRPQHTFVVPPGGDPATSAARRSADAWCDELAIDVEVNERAHRYYSLRMSQPAREADVQRAMGERRVTFLYIATQSPSFEWALERERILSHFPHRATRARPPPPRDRVGEQQHEEEEQEDEEERTDSNGTGKAEDGDL